MWLRWRGKSWISVSVFRDDLSEQDLYRKIIHQKSSFPKLSQALTEPGHGPFLMGLSAGFLPLLLESVSVS